LVTLSAPLYGAALITAPTVAVGALGGSVHRVGLDGRLALWPVAALLVTSVVVDTAPVPVLWARGVLGLRRWGLLALTGVAAAAALTGGLAYEQGSRWLGAVVLAATAAAALQIACSVCARGRRFAGDDRPRAVYRDRDHASLDADLWRKFYDIAA